MKVKCPLCKRTKFETTDRYDPNVRPNGSMLIWLGPYQIDWLQASTTPCAELTCPDCLGSLAPDGRLLIVEEREVRVDEITDVVDWPTTAGFEEMVEDENENELDAEAHEDPDEVQVEIVPPKRLTAREKRLMEAKDARAI